MKKAGLLYVVLALSEPGPKWKPVSEPIPWHDVIKVIQSQWRHGRKARAICQS